MSTARWHAPPMTPPSKRVRVDEQVVRNVLRINPGLRDGRTTLQVKKALEAGASIQPQATVPTAKTEARDDSRRQLGETLAFFIENKARSHTARREALEEKRRQLAAEEMRLRESLQDDLVNFVAMLDASAVATHGRSALSGYTALLAEAGLSVDELIARARRSGR